MLLQTQKGWRRVRQRNPMAGKSACLHTVIGPKGRRRPARLRAAPKEKPGSFAEAA